MLVIGRHEDDVRGVVKGSQQFESAPPGHVDVQEQQVGAFLGDEGLSIVSIAGLAHDDDLFMRGKQGGELFARQAFVIDDECFHGCAVCCEAVSEKDGQASGSVAGIDS